MRRTAHLKTSGIWALAPSRATASAAFRCKQDRSSCNS